MKKEFVQVFDIILPAFDREEVLRLLLSNRELIKLIDWKVLATLEQRRVLKLHNLNRLKSITFPLPKPKVLPILFTEKTIRILTRGMKKDVCRDAFILEYCLGKAFENFRIKCWSPDNNVNIEKYTKDMDIFKYKLIDIALFDNSHAIGLTIQGYIHIFTPQQHCYRKQFDDVPRTKCGFIKIACGWSHSAAVHRDGSLHVFGDNSRDQRLGLQPYHNIPKHHFVDVKLGKYHGIALHSNGSILCFGPSSCRPENQQFISSLKNIISIAAGNEHTVCLNASGKLFSWSVHHRSWISHQIPLLLRDLHFTQISAGSYYTAALTEDGQMKFWGLNLGCDSVQASIQKQFKHLFPSTNDIFSSVLISRGL